MAEYLELEKVLDNKNIIEVQTKEYGNIDVVPVEYLKSLPVMEQGFMEWLVDMTIGKCCRTTTCKKCSFDKNNNGYNTYCEKLTLEQKLEICNKIYRRNENG